MTTCETLTHGTCVFLSQRHRFGTDAMLLADFCRPRRAEFAADLCGGCGIVALRWHDEGHRGTCVSVELNGEAHSLLAAALAARLEPKRLQFVKQAPDAAPWLFLCEAQKNRRPGLTVLPDLLPGQYPHY